jgi:acetyltransferase-like isoleucine patch superfamily enzyme
LQTEADWKVVPTIVKKGASIGSGAVIMCGVTIGEKAMVGAGAVVTRDVPPGAVVVGVPARLVRQADAPGR